MLHHGCFLLMHVKKLLILAQPIRNFLDSKVGRSEVRAVPCFTISFLYMELIFGIYL